MSWLTATITIVIVAFALFFVLGEWIAARRRSGGDDDPWATG